MKMLHQQRNQSLKLLVIIPARMFEVGPVYITFLATPCCRSCIVYICYNLFPIYLSNKIESNNATPTTAWCGQKSCIVYDKTLATS